MDKTFPKVPVVGLKPRAPKICGTPPCAASVVVLCECGYPYPFQIPSVDRAGCCPGCKLKFVISEISFRNAGGQVSMNVQVAKWNGPMSASTELDIGLVVPSDLAHV